MLLELINMLYWFKFVMNFMGYFKLSMLLDFKLNRLLLVIRNKHQR
jgi:hypothetical protein